MEVVPLASGGRVLIDGNDRVRIENAKGELTGESHCGANGFSYRKATELMASLQQAMRAGDRAKVADLMSFPLRVNRAGGHRMIKDRAAFLRDYPAIFSPGITKHVLDAEAPAIFCRDAGFMLGDGVVWGNGGAETPYAVSVVNG